MSAGSDHLATVPLLPPAARVVSGLEFLAPKFAAAVTASLVECATLGIDATVYETYRTDALAKAYYERGRTVKPPATPVTNARDNVHSWHGFGLAADVIHQTLRWDAPAAWWPEMAAVFKRHGCSWGGDWHSFKDLPHLQWGACAASPDDIDRAMLRDGGLLKVWQHWGANP